MVEMRAVRIPKQSDIRTHMRAHLRLAACFQAGSRKINSANKVTRATMGERDMQSVLRVEFNTGDADQERESGEPLAEWMDDFGLTSENHESALRLKNSFGTLADPITGFSRRPVGRAARCQSCYVTT